MAHDKEDDDNPAPVEGKVCCSSLHGAHATYLGAITRLSSPHSLFLRTSKYKHVIPATLRLDECAVLFRSQ